MPAGNKYRTYAGSSSQNRANLFVAVAQRRGGAAPGGRRSVFTDEQGLGAADCRRIEHQAQMTCQAGAPRVSPAVAVCKNEVRQLSEFRKRFKKQRQLAESK